MRDLKLLVLMLAFSVLRTRTISRNVRLGIPRPLAQEPDWSLGVMLMAYGKATSQSLIDLRELARAEWQRRQNPTEKRETWHLAVREYHLARPGEIAVLPEGAAIINKKYEGMGDVQHYVISLRPGTEIRVLDTQRVHLERIH